MDDRPKQQESASYMERAWRFRDIEASWGNFLLAHTVIAQMSICAILAIVATIRPALVTWQVTVSLFVLTSIVIAAALWVANCHRVFAKRYADQFEELLSKGSQGRMDDAIWFEEYVAASTEFNKRQRIVFYGLWVALVTSALTLGFILTRLPDVAASTLP